MEPAPVGNPGLPDCTGEKRDRWIVGTQRDGRHGKRLSSGRRRPLLRDVGSSPRLAPFSLELSDDRLFKIKAALFCRACGCSWKAPSGKIGSPEKQDFSVVTACCKYLSL